MFTSSIQRFSVTDSETSLFALFNDECYLILYHFDSENECMNFEAFLLPEKRKEYPDASLYLSFDCYANGDVEINTHYVDFGAQDVYKLNLEKKIFANYIASVDTKLNDEQYLNKYSEISSYLNIFVGLKPKDIAKRIEERKEFINMIDSLSSLSFKKDNDKLVHVIPIIRWIVDHDNALLNLKIGTTKFYGINSISTFINACEEEKVVTYGKECSFKHTMASFDEESQKLIEILSRRERYYYANNYIKDSTVEDIILAYQGSSVFISYNTNNGDRYQTFGEPNKYYIDDKELFAEVRINEKGELETVPSLIDNNYSIFIFPRRWFFIDEIKKNIQIVRFKNEMTMRLFEYLKEHPTLNYQYIKDIFIDKFIPLVQDNLTIDDKYKEQHQDVAFKINYYVDINEKGELEFETKFYKGNEEISKEIVENNTVYDAKYSLFVTLINSLNIVENGTVNDEDVILSFLINGFDSLKKVATLYVSDKITALKVKGVGKINITSQFNMDWLDISFSSDEYTDEELQAILSAYKKKKKFIKLKDNIITLNDENIASLASLEEDFDFNNEDEVKVPLHELFKLNSYSDTFNISYDKQIKDILAAIKNYKNSSYTPSKIYKDVLRPYQVDAFKWLSVLKQYHLSGILADDMGLGKTLEMISFITSFDKDEPILIVTPKNVIYNWENEFKTWDKKQKVKIIHGFKDYRRNLISKIKKDEKVVYLTSYDALRGDIDFYKDTHFALMVLDEAQYIKNVSALKTKAVKAIDSEYRFVLTGTPIENSLFDLWSIFDYLMPHYLYGYKGFKDEYLNLIMNKDEVTTKRLKAKIRPFILRRIKDDVLKELPPKSETIFTVDMIPAQRELYKAELVKIKKSVAMHEGNKIQVLAELTKLRELCVDPAMLYENFEELSGKMDSAIELIKEAINGDHKVLLFSTFTKSLEHLKDILEEENISCYYIYGGTSAKERINISKSFNTSDDVKVTLVSLKAGGVGLNLVGADIVIHLDPWWNLSAENQASDRAHRIGQTRPVTIIKMVTKDSIEEKVINLQKKKAELVNAVISTNEGSVSSLSDEDISYLLS